MSSCDTYCIVCSGPLYNEYKKGNEVFIPYEEVDVKFYESLINSKDQHDDYYKLKETKYTWNWLDHFFIIDEKNKLMPGSKAKLSDSWYEYDNKNYACHKDMWGGEDMESCTFCHIDCYIYLSDCLKYKLKFTDVHDYISSSGNTIEHDLFNINYTDTYFPYWDVISENKLWLLESPLINKKNGRSIKKNWRRLLKTIKS